MLIDGDDDDDDVDGLQVTGQRLSWAGKNQELLFPMAGEDGSSRTAAKDSQDLSRQPKILQRQ